MEYSSYIICNNNLNSIIRAIASLKKQTIKPNKILIIDDGCKVPLKNLIDSYYSDIIVVRNEECMGRGFARNYAFQFLNEKYIFSLDSTNIVPDDYISRLSMNLSDSKVSGVYGLIKNHKTLNGSVYRWRAAHLFRENVDYGKEPLITTELSTYATMLNREHVLAVGNFDKKLRYLEDYDLGQRLHKNEYNIIGDPNLITYSIKEESIISVLERYWRWNVQLNSNLSFRSYLKMVHFSLTVMAYSDFKRKDFLVSIYSLLSPHYFLHKCIYEFFTNKSSQ